MREFSAFNYAFRFTIEGQFRSFTRDIGQRVSIPRLNVVIKRIVIVNLGAQSLGIFDRDQDRAQSLASVVRASAPEMAVSVASDLDTLARGAHGLINCTPVGMVGYEGTPLASEQMAGAGWAFDAVYTPRKTQFLDDARMQGLKVISGYELFFFQGVHAWRHFSGKPVDVEKLRETLEKTSTS